MSTGNDQALLGIATAIADLDHPTKVATSEWAREHLTQHDAVDADSASQFALEDWKRCADRGLLGLFVPTEFGGAGDDVADRRLLPIDLQLQACSDEICLAPETVRLQVSPR